MRHGKTFGLSLFLLAAGTGGALAQATVVTPVQQQYITAYVAQNPVPAATYGSEFDPVEGAVVPETVVLNRFVVRQEQNGNWDGGQDAVRSMLYFVTPTQQTVLVEPGTRRVVYVMR